MHFALDVTLNREQQIVQAFGGELSPMHRAAREAARGTAMREVPSRFEVVVTTNSGFPLDQNLYQAVKGMSAASTVVRDGGTIVCAAECRDGFPDHGSYREVLASEPSPQALLDAICRARGHGRPTSGRCRSRRRSRSRRTSSCTPTTSTPTRCLARTSGTPTTSSETVADALDAAGPDARVCVLPEGPQTIPYVAA